MFKILNRRHSRVTFIPTMLLNIREETVMLGQRGSKNADQKRQFKKTWKRMNRRHFIIRAGKSFPVIAGALYVVGCDSDSNDGGNNNPPAGMSISVTSSAASGHTHNADVPEADLNSTSSRSYSSSDSNGHQHTVTLSAAQLNSIENGASVTVTSSNISGHTHQFTFQKS